MDEEGSEQRDEGGMSTAFKFAIAVLAVIVTAAVALAVYFALGSKNQNPLIRFFYGLDASHGSFQATKSQQRSQRYGSKADIRTGSRRTGGVASGGLQGPPAKLSFATFSKWKYSKAVAVICFVLLVVAVSVSIVKVYQYVSTPLPPPALSPPPPPPASSAQPEFSVAGWLAVHPGIVAAIVVVCCILTGLLLLAVYRSPVVYAKLSQPPIAQIVEKKRHALKKEYPENVKKLIVLKAESIDEFLGDAFQETELLEQKDALNLSAAELKQIGRRTLAFARAFFNKAESPENRLPDGDNPVEAPLPGSPLVLMYNYGDSIETLNIRLLQQHPNMDCFCMAFDGSTKRWLEKLKDVAVIVFRSIDLSLGGAQIGLDELPFFIIINNGIIRKTLQRWQKHNSSIPARLGRWIKRKCPRCCCFICCCCCSDDAGDDADKNDF